MASVQEQEGGPRPETIEGIKVNNSNQTVIEYWNSKDNFVTMSLDNFLDKFKDNNPVLDDFVMSENDFNDMNDLYKVIDDIKVSKNYKSRTVVLNLKIRKDDGNVQQDSCPITLPFGKCITGYNAADFINLVKETLSDFCEVTEWSFVKYNI